MKKSISIFLCILLVFSVFSISVSATTNKVEEGIKTSEVPANIQHLIQGAAGSKASLSEIEVLPSESFFDLNIKYSDSTATSQVYGAPVSYMKNGEYVFIDTSMVKTESKSDISQGYAYKNAGNAFTVLFSKKSQEGIKVDDAFTFSVLSTEKNTQEKEAVVTRDEYSDGKIIYSEAFGTNTELEYINVPRGLKSNIVLKQKTSQNTFSFVFKSKTHIPVLSEDETVVNIVQAENKKEIDFYLPEIYAYDSYKIEEGGETKTNNHLTEDCHYEVKKIDDGSYLVSIVITKDFLQSSDTVYPVIIDPSVISYKTLTNIDDTYVSEGAPNKNYGDKSYLRFGYYNYHIDTNHKIYTYVRFNTLTTNLSVSAYSITSAYLRVNFASGTTSSYEGIVRRVTSKEWTEDTITWNNQPYGSDYSVTSSHHNCTYYNFNISGMVRGWYGDYQNSAYKNYGVCLTYSNETYCNYNRVHSSDGSLADAPTLTINYILASKTVYTNNLQGPINDCYDREDAASYAIEQSTYIDNNDEWDTPEFKSTSTAWSNNSNSETGKNCTNFVSQCLYKGGMDYIREGRKANDSWYYDTLLGKYYASYTWGGASNFFKHWGHDDEGVATQRSYVTVVYDSVLDALYDWTYIENMFKKGDVIQLVYSSGIGHTMIIYNDIVMKYAQHTDNKKNMVLDEKLAEWFIDPNETVKGVIFHKIKESN